MKKTNEIDAIFKVQKEQFPLTGSRYCIYRKTSDGKDWYWIASCPTPEVAEEWMEKALIPIESKDVTYYK